MGTDNEKELKGLYVALKEAIKEDKVYMIRAIRKRIEKILNAENNNPGSLIQKFRKEAIIHNFQNYNIKSVAIEGNVYTNINEYLKSYEGLN